jgi:CHAT domain-containing protein/tetratricopeptide (TPR) repeat protein
VFGRSKRIWAGFVVALALGGAGAFAQAQKTAEQILADARETVFKEGPRPALPELERALAIYRESHDRHGEAVTLGYIGFCYRQLAEYPKALEYLQRSLAMKQELGDRLEEGKSLNFLGLTYWDMGDYPQAIDHLTRALNIAREVHNPQLEGTALNNLGLVSDEQGDYKHSLEVYRQALDLHRSTHFERGESDTLGNIGGDYLLLGHYREALEYYQQALKADTRLQLKTSETIDLGNIALCQTGLGQLADAVRTFDRALALARETGQKKEEADWHKGKGAALLGLGKYDLARGEYQQALAAYRQAGQKRELIEALNEDGNLLAQLGDIPSAEKHFRRAIDLARAIGHPRGVTVNLMALGDLEWRRQRYEQAAALYQQAFDRARDADDRAAMANSLVQLALTLSNQGRSGEARQHAQKALDIARQTGGSPLEAQALYVLGELARKSGDPQKALEHYAAGEQLVETTGNPELGWQIAYGKGQALEVLQRDEEAVAAYRHAVEIIEGVTSQLQEARFQAGYIQNKYQVYVALVRLLLKMGRTGEAFRYSEKLRARSYERLLNQNLPLGGDEAEVELRSRIRQLRRAIEEENAKSLAELKRQKVQVFTNELAAAERQYQDLLDDLHRTRPADPTAQALAVPSSEEVRKALPADAALIAYVVGEESVVVFVLTEDDEHATTVPVRARDLRTKIELLRDLIAPGRGTDWVKPAESLYQILIAPPQQNGWLKGINKLYLVPNAVLNYLPFATLARPDGEGVHLLVQDYVLAYLPAASALVYGPDQGDSERTLLALAPQKSRLRYAPQEARSIGALFPGRSLVLLGRSATKGAFRRQASQFQLIHLATHGFFDKFNPIFSGIALEPEAGDDGRLEVYEIMRLHLQARLVTLSACDTALGSGYFAEYPAGDDFVGLTRAFLYAGSSAVLASLWEVNDRSTMQIMNDFYRSLRETNSAEALANAQRTMLASGGRYSRPYYWAPFIVMAAKN